VFAFGTIVGLSSFILVPLLAAGDFQSIGNRQETPNITNDD